MLNLNSMLLFRIKHPLFLGRSHPCRDAQLECRHRRQLLPCTAPQLVATIIFPCRISLSFVCFTSGAQVPSAQKSNMRHRPVGLGVQGLADVFCRLKLPFESEAAKQLNRDIFEVNIDERDDYLDFSCSRPGHLLRGREPKHRSCSRRGPVRCLQRCNRMSLIFVPVTRRTKAALPARGCCSLTCGVSNRGDSPAAAMCLSRAHLVTFRTACAGTGTVSSSSCR